MLEYFELGGEKRPVLFGFRAIYAFEKKYDQPIAVILADMGSAPRLSVIIDLLHVGLMCGHQKAGNVAPFPHTPEDVAEWMTDAPDGTLEAVMEHFAESMPQEKKTNTPAKKKKH